MSQRVDEALGSPLATWTMIIEDIEAGDSEELGEIAERLYAALAAERLACVRLRAELRLAVRCPAPEGV